MKAYIIPKTIMTHLKMRDGVLNTTSLRMFRDTTTETQYVKGDQSSSSSYRGGNHSVWDDDWSQ